jgi:hypothetical protein
MRRGWVILSLLTSIIILSTSFFSPQANADTGKAGIGVKNAPPQYSIIRLVQQEDVVRAYITVSDINSWEDIYSVSIVLENSGLKKAEFLYKQYINESTWDKINEFSEESEENNLLVTKKCSYDHSDIEDIFTGCYINLIFVFHTTWFSRLNIIASDRGGSNATLQLDYSAEDLMRSGDIIIIPGFDKSMAIEIPPYLIDIISLFVAAVGTWYFIKKSNVGKIMAEIYEKN